MSNFNYIEYHTEQALYKSQAQAIISGRWHDLDIDENGMPSYQCYRAMADYLDSLPFDDKLQYNLIDFVIRLIYDYQYANYIAQIQWNKKHGEAHPLLGDIFMKAPESNEDQS